VYTNFQPGPPQHCRALLTDDLTWDRTFAGTTTATGGNPYGTAVSYASSIGKYVILMGSETSMWRFIEGAASTPPTTPPPVTPPPTTPTPAASTASTDGSGNGGRCGCGTAELPGGVPGGVLFLAVAAAALLLLRRP
jgi:hypothetical protein